jgi:peptide/nickel transport system permease protein
VPATLELAFAALVVSLLIGVPLGIVAALKRGTIVDTLATVGVAAGNCMPTFWLGIVLILAVSVWLQLLPASGRGGIERLILPALTLGAYSGAVTSRLLRSNLIDVLGRDYVRTARAKGLLERAVIYRHSLKNAAIPVVTVVGLQVGQLLGGAVITETVFSYPGMGLLAIQAIRNRDVPVVQAFVIVTAIIILAVNLIVDLLYRYLDPRVRHACCSRCAESAARSRRGGRARSTCRACARAYLPRRRPRPARGNERPATVSPPRWRSP